MSATASPIAGRPDALEIAKSSPERVKERDKAGWLALFTADARVEDPVGAGAHVGTAKLSSFWDVFIAPQRSITFAPRRDFLHRDVAIRYVTISTVTPVSDAPFEIPAIIEYRVRGDRVASLRAFWEPQLAVKWHAQQGAKGLTGLLKHGARTTTGLGLGKAMGFGLAMRPKVRERDARRIAELLEASIGGREAAWRELSPETLSVAPHGDGDFLTSPEAAWRESVSEAPRMRIEETIVAGDHVACVLGSERLSVAAIAKTHRGRVARLDLLWAAHSEG